MAKRLTADDWTNFGLRELAKSGPACLRADVLAKRLGVSRGSFYWHFKNIDDYETIVLAAWRERTTERVISELESKQTPLERLRDLVGRAMTINIDLERAIRSWAANDPKVAKVVAAVDQRRLDYVETLLDELGVDHSDAPVRARTVYWASLGRVMMTSQRLRKVSSQDIDQMVKLIIG